MCRKYSNSFQRKKWRSALWSRDGGPLGGEGRDYVAAAVLEGLGGPGRRAGFERWWRQSGWLRGTVFIGMVTISQDVSNIK